MIVTIDQLRSYFLGNKKPTKSNWEDFFDTIKGLKDEIDAGQIVDPNTFISKVHDDGTPFVLSAKNFSTAVSTFALNLGGGGFRVLNNTADTIEVWGSEFNAEPWVGHNIRSGFMGLISFLNITPHFQVKYISVTPNSATRPVDGSGYQLPTTPKSFDLVKWDGAVFTLAMLEDLPNWRVDVDREGLQVFYFNAGSNPNFTLIRSSNPNVYADLTSTDAAVYVGRTIKAFALNITTGPVTVNLDEAHGAHKGTFVTNGSGSIVVPAGKRLAVSATILRMGTGDVNDNLIAVTAGLES